MAEKERLSFEKALARLETIVEKLDDDSLSLEESIELYEEGKGLCFPNSVRKPLKKQKCA